MDPVSEVTLSWLEQRAAGSRKQARPPSIDDGTQNVLTRVVRRGVEDAVRDSVEPPLQQVTLVTLLEERPPSQRVRVAGRVSLPKTFVAQLSPQFQALKNMGLGMESRHLAEIITRHIAIRLARAAGIQDLPPTAMMLLPRPPGEDFSLDDLWSYLSGDEDDEDEDEEDDEDHEDRERDAQRDEEPGEHNRPDQGG